ncbi:hypothetical protein KO465_02570 [Candidatus Micrarchaeota archaeon]|nr:hypothetical protein [Candidatus Micrarchaeota archaeon]
MRKWMILAVFAIFLFNFGCIEGFLDDEVERRFGDQDTPPIVTNQTNQTEDTPEPVIIPPIEEEEPEVPYLPPEKDVFECLPEYEDLYIIDKYDPHYCITNTAVATQNITICEYIPLEDEESLRRCIRVVASTHNFGAPKCQEFLHRPESIQMCKTFVISGHKYGSY